MSSPFIKDWNHQVDDNFLQQIRSHFESLDCPTFGDLSFSQYQAGIISKDGSKTFENGLYIFLFNNSFYVGKATSCTLIERLAKHSDTRRGGWFNGLLVHLGFDNIDSDYLIKSHDVLLRSKLLLIPIDSSLLLSKYNGHSSKTIINSLEMDLIIKLGETFGMLTENRKKRKHLSGIFSF
jgi:hypothetical protein